MENKGRRIKDKVPSPPLSFILYPCPFRGLRRYREIVANIRLEVEADPSHGDVLSCAKLINLKDAPILAAAIGAQADFLITLNTRHFMTDQLKSAYPSMKIVTPGEFLRDDLPSLIKAGGSG